MTTRPADAAVAATAALLLAIVAAPIALNAYLPLEDLPNHIARRYLATTQGSALSPYYLFDRGPATNSAVDMAWAAFGHLSTDVIAFSRWAAGFAVVGFVLSVAVLHRVVHGRWSVWPLAAALLVYNGPFLWGFENYVVSVPLALFAVALWIGLRDRGLALHLAATLAAAALLYLGHVLVFLAYAIIVFGYEAGKAVEGRRLRPGAVRWAGLAVILGICLAHLVHSAAAPPSEFGSATAFGSPSDRVEALLSPFGRSLGGPLLHPLVGQAALVFAAAALLILLGRLTGTFRFKLARDMRLPLVAFALATVAMPETLTGVHFVQIRFPVILLGLALAATDLRVPSRALRTAIVILLVGLASLRAATFHRAASDYSAQISDLRALARELPQAARVLPVNAGGAGRTTAQWHTAAYLVPFSEAFVPTLFVRGSHALTIAAPWHALSSAQPSALPAPLLAPGRQPASDDEAWGYAADWQEAYSHVLVLGPLPDGLLAVLPVAKVANAGDFTLYAVRAAAGS